MVDKESQKEHNRREFFTRILRYTTLGILTVISGSILAKRQRLLRDGECVNRYYCADCEFFIDCELPEAASAKQDLSDKR